MNRLQIAQTINTLAGTQGTVSTTESPTGYQAALILFIDQGYTEIQKYRDEWKFMRREVLMPLSATVSTFTNTDISKIDRVRYERDELKQVAYDDWIVTEHKEGVPTEFTDNPGTRELTFNPSDAPYLPTLYYWAVPDIMTLNGDIPVLPVEFHNLLVYKALVGLGSYLGNYDLVNEYSFQYETMMGQMMRSQLASKRLKTLPWVA